ncbi:hypothetical protein BK703_04470 [Bacillus thuringiensis serovar silo]|uniref:hypothetical protein n=1 Tax=Bacillus thuringiensis TaxID=1428 RepID=UPI000A3B2707|nr:hypothetical protein [Bacillus thuringiensis]OTW60816.1 hypothetical protein BK703_04470 [Bacillus thuringiensis serovar silo]OTW69056.1 hypothetical protein BK700_07730 [Bacillus thuringiensis serovar toguchini]
MKYAKIFVKMMAILTYIPLGYLVYLYVTNFLPKHGMIDNSGWGVLTLLVLLVPINMWKGANKL